MQKYKSQWGSLKTHLEHFRMDAQCLPNDLQWHKVLSGASYLVYNPLYQSGHFVFLWGQRCLEGGWRGKGTLTIIYSRNLYSGVTPLGTNILSLTARCP